MTSSNARRERELLDVLRVGFEAEGYTVMINPSRKLFPDLIEHAYLPDAVAIKDKKKIAIEIVNESARGSERIKYLQRLFSRKPEWEFRVYYASDASDLQEDFKAPRAAEIDAAIEEVDQIKKAGYLHAALIMAWATLEATGRAVVLDNLVRPQPSRSLIEILASQGIILPHEAEFLRRASVLRNSIAHGNLSVHVMESDVDHIIAIVRDIRGLVA